MGEELSVTMVALGPAGHGVVHHSLVMARLLRQQGVEVVMERTLAPPAPADVTHVHFTDALFGTNVQEAADNFLHWAENAHGVLVGTLHDAPGNDHEPERDARRRAAYERVAGALDAVIVCAEHERRWLPGAAVVPLPIEPLPVPGPVPWWSADPSIGVLGFIYPGKGHAEAIACAPQGVRVVALGAVSPGHGELLQELHNRADSRDVELVVTGSVSDEDLHAGARAVTVPFAVRTSPSASSSLTTWLGCGRRPLVNDAPYARELGARWPGSLAVHQDRWEEHVVAALADPARTWLDRPPPRPDAAAALVQVYRRALA
ncbi:MAG: hypothetical protein JWL64_791 [Frankiales bacterium]|nr:hypothetical protein [Frankiales bacterium]